MSYNLTMINIILYQPEIPANTGNIMRLAMAINAKVIIIGPIPFKLDDKSFLRAGMDYLKEADYKIFENYGEFAKNFKNETIYYVTRFGKKIYSDVDFSDKGKTINLMFGKESTGIDKSILKDNLDYTLRIPILSSARSLNLSNCVALVCYEVLRQQEFSGLSTVEQLRLNVID